MCAAKTNANSHWIIDGVKEISSSISELIYPAVCVVCELRFASGKYSVCPFCWREALKKRKLSSADAASSPAIGLDLDTSEANAGNSKSIPAISLGGYISPLSDILQKFKYEGFVALGGRIALALARLRLSEITRLQAEVLIPIPLHITAIKTRGFNQAGVISDILSEATGLPVAGNLVEKVVRTKNQANLNPRQRRGNLAGAFIANTAECEGKRVIIVDDVITTGATIAEVALTIEEAGAEVVGAVAITSAVEYCSFPVSKNLQDETQN